MPSPTEPSADTVAAAISIQEQVFLVGYASLPAYTILYYDYLLTLGDEIRLFWSEKLTVTIVIFYLNRYIALLGHIPIIFGRYLLSLSSDRTQVCSNLLKYHQYLAGIVQIIAGFALACRVYALYGRKWRVLYPIGAIGLAVIGIGLWALHGMAPLPTNPREQATPTGCLLPLAKNDASHYAGAWSGMLIFDTIVFTMTIYKSISRWRNTEFHQDTTLLHILLRDGSIYFGVMVILTLSVIISFYVSPDYDRGITASLTNVLSSVMISRLTLNLRDPYITSNRQYVPCTLTTMVETSDSSDSLTGCISNGETLLQQLGGTPSEVMLLKPNRTPSDATDATVVQYLHSSDQDQGTKLGDANKYQMKILESF
ncbi:hypothetical protein P691DRAFT_707960 [Macrolepiota fuliginosa MF-IS2]|uniref:DUF6533 domain-containing protein n=1 Tax=Macrolepiota fuliginosa MF-IS2 TaxID=1400762 RepID=A0A9P6C2R4_9AGAR|nr:hypothetical protein P691DRAFT_707960 [Macrolepiota fuliginosa MF-IS2]